MKHKGGRDEIRHKMRIIENSPTQAEFRELNAANIANYNLSQDSLIDPIWVAMLTLYIKKDKSMESKKLVNKFTGEMPISSIDRYFHFMHEMNLIEMISNIGAENSIEIKLTPRAIRLVEDGLRTHG